MQYIDDEKLNESGGRLFEFLTLVILKQTLPQYEIIWQPSVPQILLQPDIGIYNKVNKNLVAIGLVGHATIKSSGESKTNRNIEELFEIKESFANPIILALSFIWHSPNGWTKGHIDRINTAFDYNFIAFKDCRDIWQKILSKIEIIKDQIKGKDNQTCEKIISTSDLPILLCPYFYNLIEIINKNKENNKKLWNLIRKNYKPTIFSELTINTSVKLALQALFLLPDELVPDALSGNKIPLNTKTKAFVITGGGSIVLGQKIRISSNITLLNTLFNKQIIINTLEKMRNAQGMASLRTSMSSIEAISRRIKRTEEAINNGSFVKLCKEAMQINDEDYIERCWPLDVCTAWMKSKVNKKFGLLEAQRKSIGDTFTDYLWDPIIRFAEGNFKLLDDDQLEKIGLFFEKYLKNIPPITSIELSNEMQKDARKRKKANPLSLLLKETLHYYGVKYFEDYSFQCPFAKKANISLPSGLTVYKLYIKKDQTTIIIHVLSSYSSTHKDVEFSAKARLLRCSYNSYFSLLDGIRLVYVLDGKWSKRHTEVFRRSGAEIIPIDCLSSWIKTDLKD